MASQPVSHALSIPQNECRAKNVALGLNLDVSEAACYYYRNMLLFLCSLACDLPKYVFFAVASSYFPSEFIDLHTTCCENSDNELCH